VILCVRNRGSPINDKCVGYQAHTTPATFSGLHWAHANNWSGMAFFHHHPFKTAKPSSGPVRACTHYCSPVCPGLSKKGSSTALCAACPYLASSIPAARLSLHTATTTSAHCVHPRLPLYFAFPPVLHHHRPVLLLALAVAAQAGRP
jgi:hypothetical protein